MTFSWEGCVRCHQVLFSMFLLLAMEVYNRLFAESGSIGCSFDNLGVMVVDKIEKHL